MSDSSINMKTKAVAKVACFLPVTFTLPSACRGQYHAKKILTQWIFQSRYFAVCNSVEELNCSWSSGTFVLSGWNLSAAVYRAP